MGELEQYLVIGISALLLVLLVVTYLVALVFRESYRDKVLGSDNKKGFVGVLSPRGTAVAVVSAAMLLGTILLAWTVVPEVQNCESQTSQYESTNLFEQVAKETGVDRDQAEMIIRFFLDDIKSRLADDETVEVEDFGTYSVRYRAARAGRNPVTGEVTQMAAARALKFAPSQWFNNPQEKD